MPGSSPGMTGAFDGATKGTLRTQTGFKFSNSQNNSRYALAISRRDAPEVCIYLPPQRGRGECRVPTAPAASCALCSGRTHTSNNEYTGTPDIPARNGFNGLCRALPGDRALLPPLSADMVLSKPGRADATPQNLTPASGRQDHTILPSAATSLVRPLSDRSRIQRTRPATFRAQNAAASTASHPASLTIMIRPSGGVGWPKF